MLRRYRIGAILGKLSTILRIVSLQSTYHRLTGGGGYPPKACDIDTLAIDSSRLRISKKRQIVEWHADTLAWKALYHPSILLFNRGSSFASGETCSKHSMKTMGVYTVHFSENDQYSDFQNSPYFHAVVCINLLNAITQLVKILDDDILGNKG